MVVSDEPPYGIERGIPCPLQPPGESHSIQSNLQQGPSQLRLATKFLTEGDLSRPVDLTGIDLNIDNSVPRSGGWKFAAIRHHRLRAGV